MSNTHNDTAANDAGTSHDAAGGKLHDAAESVRDAAAAAKNAAGDTLASARDKVSDVLETAKDKSSAAYGAAAEKTSEAVEAARLKASQARRATSEGIEGNPLAALIGGIAVGVLVGALLPRTKREDEALGPIASKLTDAARSAAAAARDAGQQSLDEMGINREAARGQVDKLVDTAVKAASSAGTAAADAVRNP